MNGETGGGAGEELRRWANTAPGGHLTDAHTLSGKFSGPDVVRLAVSTHALTLHTSRLCVMSRIPLVVFVLLFLPRYYQW